MSLEEIREHYGRNEIQKADVETEAFVDFRIEQTKMVHGGFSEGGTLKVYCAANPLTYAREDRLIYTACFHMEEPELEVLREMVMQAFECVTDGR